MIVRALTIDWNSLAEEIQPFVSESQTHLTAETEYVVHALSVYKKVVFVLVIDDIETPVFLPALLFETICKDVPVDWQCNSMLGSDVDLVIGPEFLSRDLDAYVGMIDQDADLVASFWGRVGELNEHE